MFTLDDLIEMESERIRLLKEEESRTKIEEAEKEEEIIDVEVLDNGKG